MEELTSSKYYLKLESIAEHLIESAKDYLKENDLEVDQDNIRDNISDNGYDHEAVDSHEYLIYTYYHDEIIRHTNNEDAYQDVYCAEDLGQLIMDKGLDGVIQAKAYFAMSQDLAQEIEKQLEEI